MKPTLTRIAPWLGIILLLAGCSTTTVKTTQHEEILKENADIPEDQLLDVGINIFDPGVDDLSEEQEGVYPPIRRAEARYMPFQLMETLQRTGNWGVVRVIPDRKSEMNLWVDGEILESNGEELKLAIKVEDATGRVWFRRTYEEKASKYAYDPNLQRNNEDPFQGIYNRIANDLLLFRRELAAGDVETIRTVTELKFARDFSPEAFAEYTEVSRNGNYSIKRLPAENDPLLQRIRKIRERDFMFVDTLQDYYRSFTRQMDGPYHEWRKLSYEEIIALRQLRSESNTRLLGGALAVLAGVLAQGSDSRVARTAGMVGIGAGAYTFKSGLDKREEAKMHSQALEELSTSLNAEIEPHTMELQDRTVTLTGTVEEQYSQWREILRDIYLTETGQQETASPDQ